MSNHQTNGAERRVAKRVPLELPSRLRHNGLQHADVIINDLSFTGLKCETEVALKRGDMISVALPNIGLVRATVQWCRGKSFAAEFHSPVDVRACFQPS